MKQMQSAELIYAYEMLVYAMSVIDRLNFAQVLQFFTRSGKNEQCEILQ